MRILNYGRRPACWGVIAPLDWVVSPRLPKHIISIVIVRHAESDSSRNGTIDCNRTQRAELLAQTLRGVKFTHIFASHTTRARQMVEKIASAQGNSVTQLPAPGSIIDGQPVTDRTSRRAPIEPIATALLKLPPGSIALAALNSENIFGILNRLGVPVAPSGQSCAPGSMCVPCTDNSCYPGKNSIHLARRLNPVVPNRSHPSACYGAGWPLIASCGSAGTLNDFV
jgi:hypothetical protein